MASEVDTQTHRQTDRQTNTHTHTNTQTKAISRNQVHGLCPCTPGLKITTGFPEYTLTSNSILNQWLSIVIVINTIIEVN